MGFNKAILMQKMTNGECLDNISDLFAVKNNENYNLCSNNIELLFIIIKQTF